MKRKKGKTACAAALAAVCILMGGGNRICTAEEYLPVLSDIENAEKTGGQPAFADGEVLPDRQRLSPKAPEILENPASPAVEETAGQPTETAPAPPSQIPGETVEISEPTEPPEEDFSSGDQEELPETTGGSPESSGRPPKKDFPQIPDQPESPGMPEKPQQGGPEVRPGALYISREKLKKGIRSDSDFTITILLKNTWETGKIQNGKLNLELPEGLYLHSSYEKETLDFSDIQPGSLQKLRVKLRAGQLKEDGRTLRLKVKTLFRHEPEEKETEQQEVLLLPVNAGGGKSVFVDNTASYAAGDGAYGDAGGYGGGADTVSSEEKKKSDPMVPRMIVSQYDYDEDAEAGKTFETNITLCNTSEKLNVENMVVSMETGETASLQGSSNIVYVKNLKPQETYRTGLKLKTAEDGKTDSADLTLNFKYEYIKNGERAEAEASQKISIPVQIPDRFRAGEIQTADETIAGEEFTVSLPYVNKGKNAVSNVEAVIKTEMNAGETYKYLGNVEAGTSGTLDFFVTAEQAGDQKVKIALTYETSAGQEKTVEKEKVFQIAEAEPSPEEEMFSEEMMTEMGEQPGMDSGSRKKTGILAAGGGGIVLAVAAGAIRSRKRKQRMEDEDF